MLAAGQQSRFASKPSDGASKRVFGELTLQYSGPSRRRILQASFVCACAVSLGCGSAKEVLAAGGQQYASSVTLPQVQASSADAFVNSMGVVTHMTYDNTPYYNNWPKVLTLLQQLGIRHVRDGYFNPNWGAPLTTRHQQLVQSGIRTNYVVPYDPAITSQSIQKLSAVNKDMELLEAPNECDVAGNCGDSASASLANMIAFTPVVRAAGTALNLPVLGPSFAAYETYGRVGNISSLMTHNNLHIYFGGRNPGIAGWGGPDARGNAYGSFPFWLDQADLDAPGVPSLVSETGYLSFPGNPTPYTIPTDVEESYIPRTYALSFLNGVSRTYVYELLEEVNSPGYGLIDGNLNPRPAYYAIQNLIANLSDPGPSFTPGTLPYAITGGDANVRKLLLQKHDGSFWLLLWSEQSSYDPVNCLYLPVAPQQVTLSLGGTYYTPNVGTFDTTGHLNWSSTRTTNQTVPLTISDQITIVKILPL